MGASSEPHVSLPRIGLGLLLFMFAVIPVFAQSGASTGLRGRVTDTSGAAMPGVTVTLTAVETVRIEAYNVTNTPTFRNPQRDLSSANFGQITRTRGGPRVIQLGVKFRF